MLPPRHKCPPSERKDRPDPRSAKRGKFISDPLHSKKKTLAPLFSYDLKGVGSGKISMGKATKYKNYLKGLKAATAGGGKGSGTGGSEFIKRRMKLAGAGSALGRAAKASRYGKIALGIVGAGVAARQYLKSKKKKNKDQAARPITKKMGVMKKATPIGEKQGRAKAKKVISKLKNMQNQAQGFVKEIGGFKHGGYKKMGGGMMQRPMGYKGGGMDMGKEPTSKMKASKTVRTYALAQSMKDKDRLTEKDIKMAGDLIGSRGKALNLSKRTIDILKSSKKMGGGMMRRYNKGGGADTGKRGEAKSKATIQNMRLERAFPLTATLAYKSGLTKKTSLPIKGKHKKMGGGMMMRPRGYKTGMSYKDMQPYGGKYATKKKEIRDQASENVKRLTTQSDAYDPETRFILGERKTPSGGRIVAKKTTDWSNLKEEAKKVKDKYPRMNVGVYTPKEAQHARYISEPRRPRAAFGRQTKPQSAMAKKQKMTIGGSVTVKTKIGKNFPTKTY